MEILGEFLCFISTIILLYKIKSNNIICDPKTLETNEMESELPNERVNQATINLI